MEKMFETTNQIWNGCWFGMEFSTELRTSDLQSWATKLRTRWTSAFLIFDNINVIWSPAALPFYIAMHFERVQGPLGLRSQKKDGHTVWYESGTSEVV